MIKLRLKQLEGDCKEFPIQKDTTLQKAIENVLIAEDLLESQDFFTVLVNGHTVEKDLWAFTQVTKEDAVDIFPKVRGGTFGQIFKAVIVTVVAVAVTVLSQGMAGGPIAASLLGSVAGMATGLVLNALIPPPGLGNVGRGVDGSSESQMYAITAQANSIDKYGIVPRVYGTHRMFPKIVAQPYTEVEVDPSTNQLVQFYYALYDFGFGPNIVQDVRIGDTPIGQFSDVEYRLVDFNRPDTDEGDWDKGLNKTLTFYKGDVFLESIGAAINGNMESGAAVEDYRVERVTASNPNNLKSEIILTFVNPSGLIAYGTDGSTHTRNIDVRIEFRKVGESTWKVFNDTTTAVETFSIAGGIETSFTNLIVNPQVDPNPIPDGMQLISSYLEGVYPADYDYETNKRGTLHRYNEQLGYAAGTRKIHVQTYDFQSGKTNPAPTVGQRVFTQGGQYLGIVESVITHAHPWGWSTYEITLDEPLKTTILGPGRRKEVLSKFAYPNIVSYYWYTTTHTRLVFKTGASNISRKTNTTAYSTVKFTPKERGQFEVRISRLRSYSAATYNVVDSLALQSIATRLDTQPVNTRTRHTFMEVKIRATNQLSGSIQNLSAIVSSVLPVYSNGEWKLQVTDSPVWAYADILTGVVNKRPLDKSQLHMESLLEWEAYCNEVPPSSPDLEMTLKRYSCNFVLDYSGTVQEVANQIANAAQASLNIVDGKYGVLLDRRRDIPVQVFTPRNSSDFTSSRSFTVTPHALKVTFIDPASNWEQGEIVVYDNGYNYDNAETFDSISTFAVTNMEQAWRFGRYMMAQAKYRQETISITVDFEYLVCTRGDYVRISQDVMKAGGIPARVKAVNGNEVTIDEGLEISPSISLGYLIRSYDGIKQGEATILSSDRIRFTGPLPRVGDLVIIGEMSKVWFDCIVKAINPTSDLSAQLTLVEKADIIYEAESTGFLPDYEPSISNIREGDTTPAKVTELEATENSWLCGANSFEYYIKIEWEVPESTAYEFFEIYVDAGRGFDVVAETKESMYTYFVLSQDVGVAHNFKVIAVSASGKKINLIDADSLLVTPTIKNTRPLNIERLSTNITGEVLQLDWTKVNDCIREYLIRYSPDVNGSWEQSIPLLRADKNTTMASTQARTGVYLIKAVDFNDVESEIATRAITTIPELFNLNIIEETTDFPALEGSKVRTEAVGNTLMLKAYTVGGQAENEYYSDGYYYYKQFLDLGEIYTVRLQSLIRAEGYTVGDIMSNWTTLAEVEALSRSRYSEWDVETEYRATDAQNIMAEWPTLSVIDPISEGFQDNWTPWRKFTVNDATGRLIQFRLRLISNKASVTPRVFDGLIKADMPDRMESYQDLVTNLDGSYVLTYSPAFKGPAPTPSIQISIDNAQSGDYYRFDYKNLDGFRIIFYDKDGNPVQRTFDVQVKGYGRKALNII